MQKTHNTSNASLLHFPLMSVGLRAVITIIAPLHDGPSLAIEWSEVGRLQIVTSKRKQHQFT